MPEFHHYQESFTLKEEEVLIPYDVSETVYQVESPYSPLLSYVHVEIQQL